MARQKISTTIYITPEQSDRLKLLHERTKVPIAVYVREGIDMILNHYDQLSAETKNAMNKHAASSEQLSIHTK